MIHRVCFHLFVLISLLVLEIVASVELAAQDHFVQRVAKSNTRIDAFYETGDYQSANNELLQLLVEYKGLEKAKQTEFRSVLPSLYFSLACTSSLTGRTDEAIDALKRAIQTGYNDYYSVNEDADLTKIRSDPRFAETIGHLKKTGDFEHILGEFGDYRIDSGLELPSFSYQSGKEDVLVNLREKYDLDYIAGDGNESSKIINLMNWVHASVRHNGSSGGNPTDRSADKLIEICRAEKRGVTCRMIATILNEVYLAMGFESRFVTCMPKGDEFQDCHVINIVYCQSLGKWVWMDPSFGVYLCDENGTMIGIAEARELIVKGKPPVVKGSLDWNGSPYSNYSGGAKGYLRYMAKNLFRFSCPLDSQSGFETQDAEKRTYVELYPANYYPDRISNNGSTSKKHGRVFIIDNPSLFWAPPGSKK